jgi:hypothetical protein
MRFVIAIHIHDRSGKFEWILYQTLKNCQSLLQLDNILKQPGHDVITKAYLTIVPQSLSVKLINKFLLEVHIVIHN